MKCETYRCENETNVKIIQAVMGHANIETTLDIYAEVTDMKKTEAIEDLSRNLHIFRKGSWDVKGAVQQKVVGTTIVQQILSA